MSRCDRQGGFTLLEMVIAITLLGIMMALAYGALRVGNRSWSAVSEVQDANEEFRAGYRFLRRQLGQALRPREQAEGDAKGDDSALTFEGEAESISFVAPLPVHTWGGGGLFRFTLRFEQTGDGQRLWLRYAPYPPEGAAEDSVVLAAQVSEGRFSYFGRTDEADEPGWYEAWRQSGRLPLLVRLEMQGGGQNGWPALVIALRNADF